MTKDNKLTLSEFRVQVKPFLLSTQKHKLSKVELGMVNWHQMMIVDLQKNQLEQLESTRYHLITTLSKLMQNESFIQLQSQASEDMIKLLLVGEGANKKLQEKVDKNHQNNLRSAPTNSQAKLQPHQGTPPQPHQFLNIFITNQYNQTHTQPSQIEQTIPYLQINHQDEYQDKNNDLNYLVQKLINEKSFQQDEHRKQVSKKSWSMKLNDKKLYNTKWIVMLGQLVKGNLGVDEVVESFESLRQSVKQNHSIQSNNNNKTVSPNQSQKNLKQLQNSVITYCATSHITLQLIYPSQLKIQAKPQKVSLIVSNSKQKIKQTDTRQKQHSLSDTNKSTVEDQDIQLIISYYTNNNELEKFIEEPLDESIYPSAQYSIRSYLTHSQILKISSNYPNFWNYAMSKALNELFLVRVLSLDDVLNNALENITLLQKINALRRHFDIKKRQKDPKKKSSQQSKPKSIPSFLQSQRYQLHGNRQLLQQLWDLYGGQTQHKSKNPKSQHNNQSTNISFTSRLTSTNNNTSKSSQIQSLKFVQFIPSLKIHQQNYQKFLNHFAQLKKVYFNGMSVGFKGFRISNFTTRSQNNITFVFHDFHQLVMLQSLLIDFEFQLDIIEDLRREYEETPKRTIKKMRIKERFHSETRPWVEDMFQRPSTSYVQQPYGNTNNINGRNNMSFSIYDNITMIKPQIQPRLTTNNSPLNTSSVNSSFFLNPIGYCQNPAPFQNPTNPQGRRSKQIFFCKIDKHQPDYQKLIRHLNEITQVSKTVIIDFQKMFQLFQYKHKLTSLINVCCHFEAADLQLLPQPLEIVKVHQDYKANLVTLKQQVNELLENEEKFGCLMVGNGQRMNSINCFNVIKMNEQYHQRHQLYKRIRQKYGKINGDNQIFNQQFQQSINTVQLILPNQKLKNQFICFPFHNKTYKIIKYYQPNTTNLLDLQLKQTNQRSQNFIPSQQTTFNQYKQRMIKQGVDFFYFSYPFGEKFKLGLRGGIGVWGMGVRNQLKFRKEDHLRIMYWLARINRVQLKVVFYEEIKGQGNGQGKREELLRAFTKQKLPEFEQLYEFGFVQECLKEKLIQIQVYTGGRNKQSQKANNLVFKKSVHKFLLSSSTHSRTSQTQKAQAYRICTNRSTWDFVLKKLKTICEQKEIQLRRMVVSQEDDLEFEAVKKSLKTFNN